MKFIAYAVTMALLFSAIADHSNAQAPLSALGTTTTIDFSTTVTGVNNGLFDAQAPTGDVSPTTGQLDYDAWDFLDDGSASAAATGAANFPGSMPDGHGIAVGGALTSGINAVDINGTRALGDPTLRKPLDQWQPHASGAEQYGQRHEPIGHDLQCIRVQRGRSFQFGTSLTIH